MRLFNRYYSPADLALVLGDIALVICVTAAARGVMHAVNMTDAHKWGLWVTQGETIAAFVVLSFYFSDLYVIEQRLPKRELLMRLGNGFGLTCLIIGGVGFLIPDLGFQNIYWTQMLLIGAGLCVWRVGYMVVLSGTGNQRRVLIIGTRKIARLVAEELFQQKHLGIRVVGFMDSQPGELALSYGNPVRVSLPILPQQAILDVVEREGVNQILVDRHESCADLLAQELITLRLKGIPIEECHTFYEQLTSRIPVSDLPPSWIALSKGFRRDYWVQITKRAMDIIVSALGLILASPLALIASIGIKLESPGPVLYCQERTGQNERPFTMIKFRSMFLDAESQGSPQWASQYDPRVTRVGRLMRKFRMDEIPQMINVLKGEMSFVGPRPERPYFVSMLKEKIPYYHLRCSIKPGITGWAQISHPYANSEEDTMRKLEYDLYYVKYMSPLFDLQILFETFKVVILRKGAQ